MGGGAWRRCPKPAAAVLLAAAVLVASPSAGVGSAEPGGAAVAGHCLVACPAMRPGGVAVRRTLFTAAANPETRLADWVAYAIRPERLGVACGAERRRAFHVTLPDRLVLEDDDYRRAPAPFRYQRGHMAPLESFACDPAWHEVNAMVNVLPQRGAVNGGAWRRLEEGVRRAALDPDVAALRVISGPLFVGPPLPGLATDEPHLVPSGFFKLVTARLPGGSAILGFRIPQRYRTGTGAAPYRHCLATVAELRAVAGFALFPGLPPTLIAEAEGRAAVLYAAMGFPPPFEDRPCPLDPAL